MSTSEQKPEALGIISPKGQVARTKAPDRSRLAPVDEHHRFSLLRTADDCSLPPWRTQRTGSEGMLSYPKQANPDHGHVGPRQAGHECSRVPSLSLSVCLSVFPSFLPSFLLSFFLCDCFFFHIFLESFFPLSLSLFLSIHPPTPKI